MSDTEDKIYISQIDWINEEGTYGGLLSMTHNKEEDTVFLHDNDLDGCLKSLKLGQWVQFKLTEQKGRLAAREASPCEPTDEEKVHRQLIIYRDVNGMGCGTNPGSHRLDGLSMKEAKNRHRRGQMSSSDYYANMSENGLQAAANYYGSIYKEGNREETVRGLIEVIAKKQSLENHG